MEIDTKAVEERYSETESDLLQNHQSRLEGNHENVEDMDKKTLEMCRDNEEHKVNFETFKKAKGKTYGIETFKEVSYLRKGDKIRKVRSKSELVSKFILFFVLIEQVAIGKEIGKTLTQNSIQKGDIQNKYFNEESNEELVRK